MPIADDGSFDADVLQGSVQVAITTASKKFPRINTESTQKFSDMSPTPQSGSAIKMESKMS